MEQLDDKQREIAGLILFFLGFATGLCLFWVGPEPVPKAVHDILYSLAGWGAWIIPALFLFAGVLLLINQPFSFTHTTWGFVILFFVFVTTRHLLLIWNADRTIVFNADPIEMRNGGGIVGGILAHILHGGLGNLLSGMLLLLAGLISMMLIFDRSLSEIVKKAYEKGEGWAQFLQRLGYSIERPETDDEDSEDETVQPNVRKTAIPGTKNAKLVQPFNAHSDDDDPFADDDSNGSKSPFDILNLNRKGRSASNGDDNGGGSQKRASTRIPMNGTSDRQSASEPRPVTLPSLNGGASGAGNGKVSGGQATLPLFALPPLNLLKDVPPSVSKRSEKELTERVKTIEKTLSEFNIEASVSEVASGPTVTRYEITLAPGIKVNKIVSLADNLAMSLAAIDVRVEAPIPGKAAIGLEVPNATSVVVGLRECLETDEFRNGNMKLGVVLGKDVAGQFKYADLTRMPHLLIGGSTNSGKSVCLNVLIASLVYRMTPREVKMLMIDPKRVELSLWEGIPHLMHPVVKDVKLAAGIFRAAIKEMDRRYDLFAALGTRNIDGYNEKVPEADKMPYLVLIVDELADLMMQQGAEIETSICRLAQLARATGIHLIIATQRPSVDIITGTIKANISSRIAFAVASQVDSRTILDMVGADRLIGRGDMLFMPIDAVKPLRIQCAFLSENETNSLVEYLKSQEKPEFNLVVNDASTGDSANDDSSDVDDELFEQAVRLVVNNGQASTSMLQRRFKIGYTRAARIVEMMEARNIVGPLNGAKPRELLVTRDGVDRIFNPAALPQSVQDYQDEG